jgi:hypothetical protein
VVAASTKEDHRCRYIQVGIDLSKTTFHLVALLKCSPTLCGPSLLYNVCQAYEASPIDRNSAQQYLGQDRHN